MTNELSTYSTFNRICVNNIDVIQSQSEETTEKNSDPASLESGVNNEKKNNNIDVNNDIKLSGAVNADELGEELCNCWDQFDVNEKAFQHSCCQIRCIC